MKIDFSQKLKRLDGETLKEGAAADSKELTLSTVCVTGLMALDPQDKTTNAEQKVKCYGIALKINNAAEVEVSTDEISLMKKLIGKIYGPLVVGQAYLMLEGGGNAVSPEA